MQDYIQDRELSLFRREGFPGIALTDGEEADRRIYDAVRQAGDRSTFSAELARAITDWPSVYHLSRRRHCILRPLAIRPGDRVLELGCGGGAITRFLGELGAEVTAVEASLPRASIASERCRDLRNVKIFLDDVLDFQSSERFDWVLLVGVLEYAPVVSDMADPVNHCLSTAAQFLSPGGKLVVAIENKLGLKYFNGCAEDLVGVPFYGIQGLYGPHTPRTFGRHELEAHLTAIGLDHKDFYYPFPDYKLPTVIISHRALAEPLFDPAELLASCHARDCTGSPHRHFDDALVFAQAACNNLLADLSNSFLIAASAQPPAARQTDVDLAVTYAVDRVPEFATQTRFVHAGGRILVEKEALKPRLSRRKAFKNGTVLENLVGRSDYIRGRLLLWRVLRARAEGGSLQQVADAFKPWFEFILRHAVDCSRSSTKQETSRKKLSDYVLPGSFLDLTPYNIVETGDASVPIDMEWKLDREIPLGWVTARSIIHCLQIGVPLQSPIKSVADVTRALCSAQDIEFSESEIDSWLELESEFQAVVAVPRPPSSGLLSFRGALADRDSRIAALDRLVIERQEAVFERDRQVADLTRIISERESERDRQVAELTRTISERDTQIASIYASTSWRITAPLRSSGGLLRRMRGKGLGGSS